jgi:hypothetical protein
MHKILALMVAACLSSLAIGVTLAQVNPEQMKPKSDQPGQSQPQGPTGPLETRGKGAPASSPQGETPPGMQSAPKGSTKSKDTK